MFDGQPKKNLLRLVCFEYKHLKYNFKTSVKTIFSSEKEYKVTKQIMFGKARMNFYFIALVYFIDQTFGFITITII
jgi:hypothetical protein